MRLHFIALLAASLLILSCGGEEKTTTPGPAAPDAGANAQTDTADLGRGKELYTTLCVACHGPSGAGDGAAAVALDPKPRDLSDKEWMGTLDDAYLAKVFMEGGQAVGKSPTMAAFASQIKTDADRDALVAYLRSLSN